MHSHCSTSRSISSAGYVPQLLTLESCRCRMTAQHSSWLAGEAGSAPCSTASAVCVLCDDSVPQAKCGTAATAGQTPFCTWRFVECRQWRVVGINMAGEVTPSGSDNSDMIITVTVT